MLYGRKPESQKLNSYRMVKIFGQSRHAALGFLVLWQKTQRTKEPNLKTRFRALVLVFWPKTQNQRLVCCQNLRIFGQSRHAALVLWFFGQKPKNQKPKLKTRFRALVLVFWPKTKSQSLVCCQNLRIFGQSRHVALVLWFFGQKPRKPKNQSWKLGSALWLS